MTSLRAILSRMHWHARLMRMRLHNRGKSAREIFDEYWQRNHWRNDESRSGDGSTLSYTQRLRDELPALMSRRGFSSLLDLPCGDFNWLSHVEMPAGVRYVGADIVPGLVAQLQAQHGAAGRSFFVCDAVADPLPEADLWMCRDLVFHLPSAAVWQLIDNFLRSSVGHLLITSHAATTGVNADTFMGGFRLINLLMPPFSLPEPEERIQDYVEGFPERYLLLYSRERLETWRRRQA